MPAAVWIAGGSAVITNPTIVAISTAATVDSSSADGVSTTVVTNCCCRALSIACAVARGSSCPTAGKAGDASTCSPEVCCRRWAATASAWGAPAWARSVQFGSGRSPNCSAACPEKGHRSARHAASSPAWASVAARLTASVVTPTPPRRLSNTIVHADTAVLSGSGLSSRSLTRFSNSSGSTGLTMWSSAPASSAA